MADGSDEGQDRSRTWLGFWLVVIGIVAVLAAYAVAFWQWDSATDAAAALAPITAVIGALVGAFFGLQVGTEGREKAQAAKDREAEKVQRLAAAMDPQAARQVLGMPPAA